MGIECPVQKHLDLSARDSARSCRSPRIRQK
jgi:hypothetical protein